VAIDYSADRVEALDHFIDTKGFKQSVSTYYGVDQADSATLVDIVEKEYGGEPLDLVIDDASHRLIETRSSFETLFPLLRPGGIFLIEDWQWGLSPLPHEERATDPAKYGFWPTGQPLSLLGMELLLASAKPGLISKIEINSDFILVERGDGKFEKPFQLSNLYPESAQELLGRRHMLD